MITISVREFSCVACDSSTDQLQGGQENQGNKIYTHFVHTLIVNLMIVLRNSTVIDFRHKDSDRW